MLKFRRIALATLKYTALVVFAIYFLVWISSPFVSSHFISNALAKHDLQLQADSHIRYNPFKTQISISNFGINKQDKTVFALSAGELEIDLYRLFNKNLHIDTLILSGLQIDISKDLEETIEVAGFILPKEGEETGVEKASSEEDKKNTDASFTLPFTITSDKIVFEDHTFNIDNAGKKADAKIQSLTIPPININTNGYAISAQFQASVIGGDIQALIELSTQEKKSRINAEITANALSLNRLKKHLPATLKELQGEIDLSLKANIDIDESTISFTNNIANIAIRDILASLDDQTVNLNTASIDIPNFDFKIEGGQLNTLAVSLSQNLTGLSVSKRNTEDTLDQLLSVDTFALNGVKINADEAIEKSLKLSFDSITSTNIKGSTRFFKEDKALPPLVVLENLKAEDISATPNSTTIEKLHISGIKNTVKIDKNKNLVTLVAFNDELSAPPQEDNTETPNNNAPETISETTSETTSEQEANTDISTASTENSTENSTPKEAFTFTVSSIVIDGENIIDFSDNSVQPKIEQEVHLDLFTLENLSNTHNEQSPFKLQGRHSKYGKIDIAGSAAPFSEHVNAKLKGKITELSLANISSYIHDSLGFELTSGQLDTNINVGISESELDGNIKLNIRGLTMSAVDTPSEANLKGKTAMPLNVALGMLKDKKGNIELKVPLSGSVEDPSFGVESFLILVTKKAILSQAKSYLINTFVPYANVVSVAMIAGDFALKLRFEDLIYDASQVDVGDAQHTFSQQFIQLLKDKPDTQIKVCGVATPVDVGLGKDVKQENVDEETMNQLRAIAKNRAENFKSYVLENGEIASSRLLVCTPQLEFDKDAKPRIKLSI